MNAAAASAAGAGGASASRSGARHGRGIRRHRWPPGRCPGSEAGSVTAEFAVAIPAVVLVLACCVGAVQVASQQVALTDAAADVARTLARGDPPESIVDRVGAGMGGVRMSTSEHGDFVCVELSAVAWLPAASALGVNVRASGCALAGGL